MEEEPLSALFVDELPTELSSALLALAHLSDCEDNEPPKKEEKQSGPIRSKRKSARKAIPYTDKKFEDEMKELNFRTRAWKPFKGK